MNNLLFTSQYISKSDGYGVFSYNLSKNYPFITSELRDLEKKEVTLSINKKADIVIKVTAPPMFRSIRIQGEEKTLGFTMFETDELPKSWAKYCNELDEVIVPSLSVKEVFEESGVIVPIHILPLFISESYQRVDRLIDRPLTFLFSGQMDSFNRKGHLEAVQAFQEEFKNQNDVKLIFKSPIHCMDSGKKSKILEDKRIKIINIVYSEQELMRLYSDCDCFLFPTHGEGFGLPPLEAMATGMPAIVTDWMGPAQYLSNDTAYPLEVEYLEPASYPVSAGNLGYWATIDIKKLKALMRQVYENRKEAKLKGLRAADMVDKFFRFKNFNEKLERILKINCKNNVSEISEISEIKNNVIGNILEVESI